MAEHLFDTEYLDATAEADLTPTVRWHAEAELGIRTHSYLFLGSPFTQSAPYPLIGNGGTIEVPVEGSQKYFTITAPYSGSLAMQLPSDRNFTWAALDSDGDEIGSGSGEVLLALDADDTALIRVTEVA